MNLRVHVHLYVSYPPMSRLQVRAIGDEGKVPDIATCRTAASKAVHASVCRAVSGRPSASNCKQLYFIYFVVAVSYAHWLVLYSHFGFNRILRALWCIFVSRSYICGNPPFELALLERRTVCGAVAEKGQKEHQERERERTDIHIRIVFVHSAGLETLARRAPGDISIFGDDTGNN